MYPSYLISYPNCCNASLFDSISFNTLFLFSIKEINSFTDAFGRLASEFKSDGSVICVSSMLSR